MSLLAIGAAAFAIGCGSSDDGGSSGTRASASDTAQTVPGQDAPQAAETATQAKADKAAAKSDAKTKSKTTAPKTKAQAKANVKYNAAERAKAKKRAVAARKALKKNNKQRDEAYAKIFKNAREARAKIRAQIGDSKKGPSGIPIAVNKTCAQNLRGVAPSGKQLNSALDTTIIQVKRLAAENSPAASGTTGDLAGRIRANAILDALRKVKKFAGGGSSQDLQAALEELSSASRLYEIRSCRIA